MKSLFNRLIFGKEPHSPMEKALPETSESDIENILSQNLTNLDERSIHYLMLLVRSERLQDLPVKVAPLVDQIVEYEGSVMSINCGLIIATFGAIMRSDPSDRLKLESAIDALGGIKRADIKFVYGSVPGFFMTLGSDAIMNFGPLLPDFPNRVATLLSLAWGEHRELS